MARHDVAAERLRQAVGLAPGYLPARVRLAESLLDTGNLEESRTLFESLAREQAAAPVAEFGIGRIEAARGLHEDAIGHFQRAIALFPEFGSAYYAMALSYRAGGRLEEARAALDKHAQFGARWPAVPDPVRASLETLREDGVAVLQRGIRLAESGDLPGAITAHEAALARDGSLALAHANLISLYGKSGDLTKAEEHYRALASLGVDLSSAHYDYGVLLGVHEKWDLAEQAYRRALAAEPTYAYAHNNLGQILERRREFEAAASEYQQAVESQPTFRLARFNLGRMWLALGRNHDAITELSHLTEPQDEDTPQHLFALSTAYVRVGDKATGMKWALEARRLALERGQTNLAATIDRDLAKLK